MVAAPPMLIHPGAVDSCGLRGFSRPDAPLPAVPPPGPLGIKKERRSPRRPFPVKICENSRPPSRRPCPLSLDIPGFSHVLPSCPALSRLSQLSCLFTDSFLRTDFNGDLSAIDAALLGLERDKCRAAIGRYTEDGELSYTVSLGARPKLAVVDNTSSFSSGYELGLDGMNERSVIITEDGFRVNGSPHGLNQEGTLYRYYAFL